MNHEQSFSILDDIEALVNEEARDTANFVLDAVLDETPIDTGEAKGSWQITEGEPTRKRRAKTRRRGSARREGRAAIKAAKLVKFPTLFVTSVLPYIRKLNNGHSKQAPSKFIDMIAQRARNAIVTKGGSNG